MSPPLEVEAKPGQLGGRSWHEYAIRFLFGGLVTATTGLIAHVYGPVVGGLFLAFPAILPASLTLIGKHEGERAAGADALGAAIGSGGLVAFGAVVWALAPRLAAWQVLAAATFAWLVGAVGLWTIFELVRRRKGAAEQRAGGVA